MSEVSAVRTVSFNDEVMSTLPPIQQLLELLQLRNAFSTNSVLKRYGLRKFNGADNWEELITPLVKNQSLEMGGDFDPYLEQVFSLDPWRVLVTHKTEKRRLYLTHNGDGIVCAANLTRVDAIHKTTSSKVTEAGITAATASQFFKIVSVANSWGELARQVGDIATIQGGNRNPLMVLVDTLKRQSILGDTAFFVEKPALNAIGWNA